MSLKTGSGPGLGEDHVFYKCHTSLRCADETTLVENSFSMFTCHSLVECGLGCIFSVPNEGLSWFEFLLEKQTLPWSDLNINIRLDPYEDWGLMALYQRYRSHRSATNLCLLFQTPLLCSCSSSLTAPQFVWSQTAVISGSGGYSRSIFSIRNEELAYAIQKNSRKKYLKGKFWILDIGRECFR